MLLRIRSVRHQLTMHRRLGLAGPFFPGICFELRVGQHTLDCVYVSFGTFTTPLFLADIPSKGICWGPYGADLSDINEWRTIYVDNLHMQPSYNGAHSIFSRTLIYALRANAPSFEQYVADVKLRTRTDPLM
eukprot:TRINITY_DN1173_c0_g2_i4.p1 TRINITY_DN1173_c0_g2~~TRINITY_DN1173_c0_g2_i4.p1  ORF type:complete len:132 (-),score=11.70 TRINITY_DN1173_c0_g2_i4:86-481(-)